MRWSRAALGAAVCLLLLTEVVAAPDADAVSADEQTLKEAKLGIDGPALLQFFRKRTLTEADREHIATLIRQLGDKAFAVREKASGELLALGTSVVPQLRQAVKNADLEVVRRAEDCLRQIEGGGDSILVSAAARLLALRKPTDAAATLLTYLPFATEETVEEEVRIALTALAVRDGKAEPVLVHALADKLPMKRAAGGEALAAVAEQRPAVRKLLDDPEPFVRLRVALALTVAREKDAVPVLIELLVRLPESQAWPAQDLLYRLAGEKAPPAPAGNDPAARARWHDEWAAWWRRDGASVDLAKLEAAPRWLGHTLVVLLDKGQVLELDAAGKPRWQIDGLASPLDAYVLPGDRVLITEFGTQSVTERNFKGEVLWQHKLQQNPVAAQRLANGNTFIVTHERLIEVRRDGTEVFTHALPGSTFTTAQKLTDGRIGCVLSGAKYVLLDAAGKELKSFAISTGVQTTSALDALPGGHVLLVGYGNGSVVEHDAEGKEVWEAKVSRPISAVRLPNGNTLVSSQDNVVIELDRSAKVVREEKMPGHPTRARRR